MKHSKLSFLLVLISAIVLMAGAPTTSRAQGETPEPAFAKASELFESGQYKEAAEAFQDVVTKYPTWMGASGAQFQLGYLCYVLGDYDKSLVNLKKIVEVGSPASPDLKELASSLIPQGLAAKASHETNEAKRTAGYEGAIKGFDDFLKTYPQGEEVEGAIYGKALASYQIAKYDEAVAALRGSLTRFARSPSILDSQYLLALTLATEGNVALQQNSSSAEGIAKYDEAEKLMRDIITKGTDVALANEAQFQVGELLFNRGTLGPESGRDAAWQKAIDAYRTVKAKDLMIKAQEQRLELIKQFKFRGLQEKNKAMMAQADRLRKSEISKLAAIKEKGDVTVSAQLKVGQIFFQQKAYDEARVLFRQMQQFAEDNDQKKSIQYYLTLTYAYQKLTEKAVQGFNDFNAAFKGDPMADNLPLLIGSLFLTGDPKTSDPEKAAAYFKEGSQTYPNGRFANETLTQQANTLIQLKRYDEALATFTDFLKRKPKQELACAAEFGIGTVYRETTKLPQAIAQYKKVRDTYAGTPQAEQSAFWVAQLSLQKTDIPGAIKEYTSFLEKFPKSELFPTAKFGLGQALVAKKDNAGAMKLFKELADEYPKSTPAPYTFFQRASILSQDQKVDEMIALMKEFIQKYPEDDKLFYAYDSVGQNAITTGKSMDAIALYGEFVEKHPQDPHAAQALLNVVQLWHQYALAQGRYLALNEEQRAEWNKGNKNSTAAAEKLITNYPASEQVATALQELLDVQKLLLAAKLKTEADLEKYFGDLAAKFDDKPETKSKVLFTLASFIYDSNKDKGLDMMNTAYNSSLTYAPEVIDLYGSALLEAGKVDESHAIYEKLSNDFPIPTGVDPDKAAPAVQAAQAIAMYGLGKAMQKQGKIAETQAIFEQLKKYYPWSPKLLEADFGIAEGKVQAKQFDEAATLLVQIIRAQTATADLRANAMFLKGSISEQQGDIASAIDQYIKIAVFYEGVPKTAAEGLWKGAQLLEQQAPTLPEVAKKKGDATRPGQMAKAVQAYKDLVSKYATSPHAKEAQERLKVLAPGK